MNIDEFARLILFGNRLEDKLFRAELQAPEDTQRRSPIAIPSFPGRPPHLLKAGKADFPSIHKLYDPIERAKVLHFFANHELLAMELMALAILRFPDAPHSFRQGLAQIIQEEQSHLRLYLSRMTELGIQFGDLSVNHYFWNLMKGMESPLQFTVQMSLTFEQANLDFSFFFRNEVNKTGDDTTTAILERVFREEIGHVKHGLIWFNRWRDQTNESDWEAYLRLLPLPLSPQRAKGFTFCADARKQAGFSEEFIRELKVYSGSKGRPPTVWTYNPQCDTEIVRGRPGFSATKGAQKLSLDLEHLPLFLCLQSDIVLLEHKPRIEWLESLQEEGFDLPEWVEIRNRPLSQCVSTPKIGGIQPWGWSPKVFSEFRPLRVRLVETSGGNASFCSNLFSHESYEETNFGNLFSKSWSAAYLSEWLHSHPDLQSTFGSPFQAGQTYLDWESAWDKIHQMLLENQPVMAKAPYGTSGMQNRKVEDLKELDGPLGGWIKNVIHDQGGIVIEPWLDKVLDFSIQIDVQEDRIHLFKARPFLTGNRHEYRGTYLGKKWPSLGSENIRFFHQVRKDWQTFLKELGQKLREKGYRGPAGVDAFLWKDKNGKIFIKPLVELNPRWTMGRVAIELEKHLAVGVQAIWLFIPLRKITQTGYTCVSDFVSAMKLKYPLLLNEKEGKKLIQSGVIFTNDPMQARSVLTVLATLPNESLMHFL